MTALAHAGAAGGGRAGTGTGAAVDSHDRIVPSMREGSGLRLVSPELVGRDSELSTFAQLIGSVAAGSGATLLLSGEAGMDSDPTLEALLLGWSLGPEPDPYLVWHSSQIPDPATRKTGLGFAGFRNAEVDRAIEEARNPSNGDCSVAARKKHYETFNRILNEEEPYNFGWSPKLAYVTSGRLQGFHPGSFGIGDVQEWWFRDR